MEKPSVTRESDKFMLRFPDGMRDRLKEAAHTNGRSMNAEIVARLQASFEASDDAEQLRRELESTKELAAAYRSGALSQEGLVILQNGMLRDLLTELPDEMRQQGVASMADRWLRAKDLRDPEMAKAAMDEFLKASSDKPSMSWLFGTDR